MKNFGTKTYNMRSYPREFIKNAYIERENTATGSLFTIYIFFIILEQGHG